METKQLIKTGRVIAILSFLIGTAIFIVYYLTSADFLLSLGGVFILVAAIINSIFLILILRRYSKEKHYKTHLFITAGIILLNIPAFLFYSWVTFLLMDTMRISFINSTQETITELKITGCQNKTIKKLDVGQSEMIWINIEADCTINIDYLLNGESKKETVLGYATTSMGQKMKYKIGEKKE
ncbi:hypothetical protein [Bernardetia sp. MNP-M8]|uniref:hypothetical protein n=1 Tax=Bernardetia sp. MNP-M8 TaxID=3127470 RepID=UPI0030D08B5B